MIVEPINTKEYQKTTLSMFNVEVSRIYNLIGEFRRQKVRRSNSK